MLTPLLRLAVALDVGRTQKVHTVDTQVTSNAVNVTVRGDGDFDLEIWAAERAADWFRQTYSVPLNVIKAR
jgi:hypothetical protein